MTPRIDACIDAAWCYMALHDETSDDWTESVMTRVSHKAKKALESKLNALQGVSQSAYVRRLIYRDLGFLKETE